jgi:hypothetical protein
MLQIRIEKRGGGKYDVMVIAGRRSGLPPVMLSEVAKEDVGARVQAEVERIDSILRGEPASL